MLTMEFEELQKIWDTQNNKPMYVINEQALHKNILKRKEKATHIANFSEWILIIVNAAVGLFILAVNLANELNYIFMYLLAALLAGNAVYSIVSRIRRIHTPYRFDNTMLGDLQQALFTASYQVRLSRNMRLSSLFVIALTMAGVWEGKKSISIAIAATVFFVLVFFASKWEHNYYKTKKRELETLLKKLQQEEANG